MKVEAISGGKIVLASGSVISFGNEAIELNLRDIDGPGDDLKLVFNFRQDPSIQGKKTSARGDGRAYVFELVNYSNALGQGVFKPYEFATTGDRKKLYISFVAYNMADMVAMKLTYAIYKDC